MARNRARKQPKFDPHQLLAIINDGRKIEDIARHYRVDPHVIADIQIGKAYPHITRWLAITLLRRGELNNDDHSKTNDPHPRKTLHVRQQPHRRMDRTKPPHGD